jgi:bifunctional non-homologous end joining protein LigD
VIVEAATRLRATSFVLDGEGVIPRPDDLSDFDRLHSRRHEREVAQDHEPGQPGREAD